MPYFKAKRLPERARIYGAKWYGTADSSLERTDDAAGFSDPVPALSNGTGSSPFDNIMPWSGMVRVEDTEAGTLVKIPKFYYRWIIDGITMKLQISMKKYKGFYCSPAHMDRGDGQGERDAVYVGRYHCASDYKSKTGVLPKVSATRATFRSNIHSLGNEIWQSDFALIWTIRMLYLVEFADWNSQNKIGYGCAPDGSTSAVRNMGYTDAMQYHTGTDQASRTTYGGTQYRWIEGLWDNCFDWCDGIYFSGANIYGILNTNNFSDTTNGTLVGARPTSSNFISALEQSSVNDYEWCLYPSSLGGGGTTYVCDYCYYNASGVVLHVGGGCDQSQNLGLFCLGGHHAASYSSALIGSRLMKLPNNT